MLDKMISVGPPQKGVAPDAKVEKDFRNSADSKVEFEKALKEKMQSNKDAAKQSEKDKQKLESKEGDKTKEARNEDTGTKLDKKDKKSSGGIKKKMTDENDDKMVSNIMASLENEVETPESKTDLAEIEIGISKAEQKVNDSFAKEMATALPKEEGSAKETVSKDMLLQQMLAQQTSAQDVLPEEAMTVGLDEAAADPQMNSQLNSQIADQMQKSLDAYHADKLPQVDQAQAPDISKIDMQKMAQADVQSMQQQQLAAAKMSSAQLEQQLGDEVGFQSDLKTQMSGSELIQKMKSFEAEKNLAPDKALAFETAVLDQLKKQMAQPMPQGQTSDQSDKKDDSKDSLKDLKSDLIGKNDNLHHAGQTHTDFKTQLTNQVDKAAGLSQAKLEENHDKNIQEIMNKANYLVTKGGGEMKVSMSPEGMGEIQLKVLLQDGKLNVEIQTQDKSVKKMIEDSLSELKSGLAAHRLSIEHVRIDTVNATNTDNSAQNQPNWNNGGSESKQREFWNQFQQNLGQQPGRSPYSSGSSVTGAGAVGATSAGAASTSSALRTYGGTKGATVNRVA